MTDTILTGKQCIDIIIELSNNGKDAYWTNVYNEFNESSPDERNNMLAWLESQNIRSKTDILLMSFEVD